MKLIRKAKIYAPEFLGIKDVLLAGGKIIHLADHIDWSSPQLTIEEIDGTDKILTPGFIDCHFHLLGGGGEGGFQNRTPEVQLTDLTKAGVTTVVGCLGTDGIARDMSALIAKAKGLEFEGITTYLYDGSYRIPVKPVTDSVMQDILLIDKIIGVGELAIADHRSSQPTFAEFARIAADARVGGMLSGKAGIINVHLGDGEQPLSLIEEVIAKTEIPITQFLPTHINRTPEVFEASVSYAKQGGYVDFTASEDPDFWEEEEGEIRFSKGLKRLLDEGIGLHQFTMTSDGQGSLPYFDGNKELIGLGIGSAKSLLINIQEAVLVEKIPLEIALRSITSNPAMILKLGNKGRIAEGLDADFCLLDEKTLKLDSVIAKGQMMVKEKHAVVFGTFQ